MHRPSSRILPRLVTGAVACITLLGSALAADVARVFVGFQSGQKAVAKGLIQQARGVIHHEFDTLNAIATTLPAAALAGLGTNPAIRLVEPDPPRYLLADTKPYGLGSVQATAVWDADNNGVVDAGAPTGAGLKVGVIDSGIFTGHSDFAGVNISGYAGNLPWNVDGDGHGTHVCGTIAANLDGSGVVGVSPGQVQLYMVRVFGNDGSWAYSSTLIDAANRCASNGCRIISMSLGGSFRSNTEDSAFASLYNQGILLIAAAGNDGTTSVSYPAGYASVISVAAVDSNNALASFSQRNADVELAAPGVGVLSTVPYVDTNTVTTFDALGQVTATANGYQIEGAARGTRTAVLASGGYGATADPAWSGKVVLVQRGGNLSFAQKVQNVQAAGGVACVIYNNVAGDVYATLGDGVTSTIPAITVSDTVGAALLGQVGNNTTVTSTLTTNVSGYAYYDGTSMATPHVSGVAALVWSAKPTALASEVRSALQSTALDLGTAGRDSSFGFGLVRAKSAITALLGSGGGGGSADITPPIISNVAAAVVNAKQATFKISWTTDEPSTTVIAFDGGTTYTNTTLVTSHTATFRGTKGATYTYTVRSADASGNTASSGPRTFINR